MRPRGVYFLWLLHAHSIILYSFLHLTPRISRTSPLAFTPPISRAYAILHGAHASLTPPYALTIPLAHHFLRPSPPPSSPPSISTGLKSKLLEIGSGRHRTPPIPQGNTWPGSINALGIEILFRALAFQLPMGLSLSRYFFPSLSIFSFFSFLSLQFVPSSSLSAILKEITNEYVMSSPPSNRDRNQSSCFPGFVLSVAYFILSLWRDISHKKAMKCKIAIKTKTFVPKSELLIYAKIKIK